MTAASSALMVGGADSWHFTSSHHDMPSVSVTTCIIEFWPMEVLWNNLTKNISGHKVRPPHHYHLSSAEEAEANYTQGHALYKPKRPIPPIRSNNYCRYRWISAIGMILAILLWDGSRFRFAFEVVTVWRICWFLWPGSSGALWKRKGCMRRPVSNSATNVNSKDVKNHFKKSWNRRTRTGNSVVALPFTQKHAISTLHPPIPKF